MNKIFQLAAIFLVTLYSAAGQTNFRSTREQNTTSAKENNLVIMDEWKSFENKNFSISFDQAKIKIWGKTSHGQLTLINKNDTTVKLIFHAFRIADTDSAFFKEINNWYLKQSCLSIGELFRPFFHKKFYYYLEPCDKCQTRPIINGPVRTNLDCAELLTQLKNFVTSYPR